MPVLRRYFHDDLFIRTGKGVEPTARATDLAGPVRDMLEQALAILREPQRFDPATSEVAFRLAMGDAYQIWLLPLLLQRVQAVAPQVRIRSVAFDRRRVVAELDDSEIDLAIGVFPNLPARHRSEALLEERHVCLFNPELVPVRAPIKLKDYLAYPHILLTLAGDDTGKMDEQLKKVKQSRFVMATAPAAYAIPYILTEVRAIGIVPQRLAASCAKVAGLTISPPPIDLGTYTSSMVWHVRKDQDAAQQWLRQQIREASHSAQK